MPQPSHLLALLKDLQDQHQQLVEVLNLALDDLTIAEIPQTGEVEPSLNQLLLGYARFVEDRIDIYISSHDDR